MEEQEKTMAKDTFDGLVEGLQHLFTKVLDSQAPIGYKIIIKNKPDDKDDFCRERNIGNEKPKKLTVEELIKEVRASGQVAGTQEQFKSFIAGVQKQSYAKGKQDGYREAEAKLKTKVKSKEKSKDNSNANTL